MIIFSVLSCLQWWRKSLSKAKTYCQVIRKENISKTISDSDFSKILKITDNPNVTKKLNKPSIPSNMVIHHPQSHFFFYCMALMLIKFNQRPGVVQGFTIGEFTQGLPFHSQGHTYKLLKIINHKSGHKGPTSIFIPDNKVKFFEAYHDLVRLPQNPKPIDKFFLTSNLKSPNNISERLGQVFRTGNLEPVSLTFIRKCGETIVPDTKKEFVSQLQRHSEDVAMKSHRHQKTSDLFRGYRAVNSHGKNQNFQIKYDVKVHQVMFCMFVFCYILK